MKQLLAVCGGLMIRVRSSTWGNTSFSLSFFFLFFFEHNYTPSGKKTVTGMQVVTTSQGANYRVQVEGHFVPAHNRWCVRVCVCGCNYTCTNPAFYQKANVECVCGDANW